MIHIKGYLKTSNTPMKPHGVNFPSVLCCTILEYAGAHHETIIDAGYPCKLTKEELSILAHIIAVADIFEALTACKLPIKSQNTL